MQDVSALNKDDLKAYAESGDEFPVLDLDLRKGIEALRKEVVIAQELANPPTTAKEGDLFTKNEVIPSLATHIKNKATGNIFPITNSIVKHLAENGIICDKSGNPA